jgi:hypothetical protein
MAALPRIAAAVLVGLVAAAVAIGVALASFVRGGEVAERIRREVRDATGRELAWGHFGTGFLPPRIVLHDVRLGGRTAALPAAAEARSVALHLAWAPLLARELVVTHARVEGATLRAAPLELADVEGEAFASDVPDALRVAARGRMANGSVEVGGDVRRGGALDLVATLAGVDPGPFAPWFASDLALAGRADGSVRARGPATELEALDVDVEIADARVRAGNVSAAGPVTVKARLRGAPDALEGEFDLEATRAELSAYGGAFVKPPGAPATASGRLVRDGQGRLGVDGVRLQIKNMDGKATVQPGAWRIDVTPFDLAQFLGLAHGPLELAGALRSAGATLASDGARLVAGGQPIEVAWQVDLAASPARHALRLRAAGADAQALLAALTGEPDLLEGRLALDAAVAGPLGADPLGAATGSADAHVGAGRIPNVSPLRAALDALARYDAVVRVLDREDADRALAPYLGDRFESLVAQLDVGGGRARTREGRGWNALVLRYPGYRLELRGSMALADQSLDARGRVVLDPALEAALAERAPGADSEPRVIEVANVRGTLAAPELVIDQAGAVAFAASLGLAQRRDEWEHEIDERLGEGAGSAILDALDGSLGKQKR